MHVIRETGVWHREVRLIAIAVALAITGALAGCTSVAEKLADKAAYPVMEDFQKKVEDSRPKETPPGVITPKAEGPQISTGKTAQLKAEAEVLTLKEALKLAFSTSREFQYQKESFYLSALSYTSAIREYRWRPSGTLSSSVTGNASGDNKTPIAVTSDATMGLTRRLLSGGVFTLSGGIRQTGNIVASDDSNSSSGSIGFAQPLLKGAGTAAGEQYIQIQRGMLNAARSFETFRQDLVIRTLSKYYGMIRQKKGIENARIRLERANFNYEQARARFDKGKQRLLDLLQMEQDKLQAENQLNDEIEAYITSMDDFKLTLGLPMDKNYDLADEKMEPEIVTVNLEEAIKTAFANRFDVLQMREARGDAERALRIARDSLLPTLSFAANASIASDGGKDFWEMSLERGGKASAGLTLQIPIDNKADRDAYKAAVMNHSRQMRGFEQTEESVKLSVRQTVRKLRQTETALALQKRAVESAERQGDATQIQFERGTKSARDIVDAEKAVRDARDAYVQAQVDYMISSIQLRKDLGTLQVDEDGNWR